jgi:hypothetical protein
MKLIKYLLRFKYYLVIIVLGLLFYNTILINQGKILSGADIKFVYSPYKTFFSTSLKTYLELPLWNPYIFSGQPFLANPTAGILYPLNYLFALINVDYAFGYLFVIDTILIGLFTFLYSRAIKLSEFASLVSSVVFMFSGTIATRIFPGHLFVVDAFVWFPLILFSFEKIISTQKIMFAFLGSTAMFLIIIAGHTQIAFYSIFISLGYLLLRSLTEYYRNKDLKKIVKIYTFTFLSLLFALGLSAILLLPMLEFSKLSVRNIGISFQFATAFSTHPYQLLSFILPNFYGSNTNNTFWGIGNEWEVIAYLGIIPLMLCALALCCKRNKYTFIFAVLAVFSILFSLGKHFFLFSIFFKFIPFFATFRVPARMLFMYSFSVSILAGFGIDFLLNLDYNKHKYRLLKLFNSLILLILFAILSLLVFLRIDNGFFFYEKYVLKHAYAVNRNHFQLYNQTVGDLILLSVLLFSYLLLFFLLRKKIIGKTIFGIIILSIIFFNSFSYISPFIKMDYPNNVYPPNKIVNYIKKDNSIFRVFDFSKENYEDLSRNKLQSITGVDAIFLKDYRDYLWKIGSYNYLPYDSYVDLTSIKNENMLSQLNVKYIISNKKLNLNAYKLVDIDSGAMSKNYLYENIQVFPRAYALPISDTSVNNNNLQFTNSKKLRDAQVTYYSPNKIIVSSKTQDPGFLVLSEIYYPGWKAYDNGKEVAILRTNQIFRSVYLNEGYHSVVFKYDPFSFRLGILITFATLASMLLCLLWILKPKLVIFWRKLKLKLPHLP